MDRSLHVRKMGARSIWKNQQTSSAQVTVIFTLKEVDGGNTICIYHHSEAWRRGNSRKHTKEGNRLPSCILGAIMYGFERNGMKWPPDGQQSWNRISVDYGDRLQSSLVSKIGYFDGLLDRFLSLS